MSIPATGLLVPLLTPHGHLRLAPDPDAPPLPAAVAQRLGDAFARGSGHGLLHLGAAEVGSILPPSWSWWREFAARYVTALCATPEGEAVTAPGDPVLEALIADAPPMAGAEYLSPAALIASWNELDAALREELVASKGTLQAFLKSLHPVWNLVGRVHFNLAENRKDAEAPFAFLATYASRVSAHGKAQHLPLSRALAEFSDGRSHARLLALLMPVQRAAEQCEWLRAMVDSGAIYHPLRWQPADA
jgi:non-specific serine/threonine protein kinase